MTQEKQTAPHTEISANTGIYFDGQEPLGRVKNALSFRYDSTRGSSQDHRDRLFLQLLLGLCANHGLLTVNFYFFFPHTAQGRTVGVVICATILALYLSITVAFLKWGKRVYCVNLLLSGMCVLLAGACFWLDGVMSPTMMFLMMLPVFATTVTNSKWAVFWTVVVVACWMMILVLQNSGVEMNRVVQIAPPPGSIQLVALLGTTFVIMSLLGSYVVSNARLREAMELKNERLDYLASHDPLTSIPNRRAPFEHAQQCLMRAARAGKPFALVVIDLNDFKQINDTLGHSAGDAVLQHFANRLKQSFRETDFVARMGGDELGVIIEAADASSSVQLAIDRSFKVGTTN